MSGRVAHFLLDAVLAESPPNRALRDAFHELGLGVDLFAPGGIAPTSAWYPTERGGAAEYGWRWLARNGWRPRWRRYRLFAGTSEDPLAVVGALSRLHRRPAVALVDEIKAGSYRGDASARWKALCLEGIRRARVRIVNDRSRIELLRDYASLASDDEVLVYPGGYHQPPGPVDRAEQRRAWGLPEGALVVGFSGGMNLTTGLGWLVEALQSLPALHGVVQPTGIDDVTRLLFSHLRGAERVYLQGSRLGWREAWSQAAAVDVGMSVYLNDAPQFQRMGTSSNRLCMFLAMGVPVIASRQESFAFLEQYDCGILVETAAEFRAAVERIGRRLEPMRANARRCWSEYVNTKGRYEELVAALRSVAK